MTEQIFPKEIPQVGQIVRIYDNEIYYLESIVLGRICEGSCFFIIVSGGKFSNIRCYKKEWTASSIDSHRQNVPITITIID